MQISRRQELQFLKASDFAKESKTEVVKYEETKDRKGRDAQVIHIKGYEKVLSLNATNTNAMIDLFGPETDNWIGKKITIVKVKTEMNGKPVDGVRISATK